MDKALSSPDVLGAGADLQIVALVFIMAMKLDAIAGEAAGNEPLDSLISGLAGRECSGSDGRLRHRQNPP
ncbi:hypothetical protein [Microvirga sp. G4-2]|uniref:hypothetical protein n=1 Tax=Microvirga sp. G4-2 TaxID=3434467 RepID=UPI004044B064